MAKIGETAEHLDHAIATEQTNQTDRSCPLWVRLGRGGPFFATAALSLKPDIDRHGWHGRNVPWADIAADNSRGYPREAKQGSNITHLSLQR